MMHRLLILFFLLIQTAQASDDIYQFKSPEKAAHFAALTNEVRCVVCQNQSLAESTAPLATDLREKIFQMIEQDKTDSDIKNYLVARYGEFILLRPRLNQATIILWAFPLIALVIAFFLLIRSNHRKPI